MDLPTILPVFEQEGLEVCWNKTICYTDQLGLSKKVLCFECVEYDIPSWLAGYTSFLWVLFCIDFFVAFYWMTYMWNHQKCRESIFKFADNRPSNVAPLPGTKIRSCCCWVVSVPKDNCNCIQSCFSTAEKKGKTWYKFFKKIFCLPDNAHDEATQIRYNYYNDIIKPKFDDDDLVYGHKAFFWPKEKPKFTFSAKSRINFSLALQYSPILALLIDFFCDINYLNQIALYTNKNLLDKHIQIDKTALIVLCVWDLFEFFTIPLTCMVVHKMSFTPNLKVNLMGEVVLLTISYLLADGVELMIQYAYLDKFAGTRYDYLQLTGIVNIAFSVFISFTLAVGSIFVLSHLFMEVKQAKRAGSTELAGETDTKGWILTIFLFSLGLIPLLAIFCRVIASTYQIFTFKKYRDGCLHFELDETMQIAEVIQATLFDYDCWRAIDYPLIFGNFVGLGLHFLMGIYLLVEHFFGSPLNVNIVKGTTANDITVIENAIQKPIKKPKKSVAAELEDPVTEQPITKESLSKIQRGSRGSNYEKASESDDCDLQQSKNQTEKVNEGKWV